MILNYSDSILTLPFSILIAFLITQGILAFGKILAFYSIKAGAPIFFKQSNFPLGLSLIIFFLSILMVFGLAYEDVLKLIGLFLVCLGCLEILFSFTKFINSVKKYRNNRTLTSPLLSFEKIKKRFFNYLPLICLVGTYFFLTLLPQSSADSINYHLPSALNILQTGSLSENPGWFMGRLAGNGEILLALGLSLKTEHLFPMIHFFLMLNFLGMIKFFYNKDLSAFNFIPYLLMLLSPVLIMLFVSSKPQFIPIMLSSCCFWLLISYFEKDNILEDKQIYFVIAIIFTIAGVASQLKFNFILSYFILSIYCLLKLTLSSPLILPKSKLIFLMLVIFLCFGITSAPLSLFKYFAFGGSFWTLSITLFNGEFPGYDNFYFYVSTYRDSYLKFPISLVIPDRLGSITSVLGLMPLIFLFFSKTFIKKYFIEVVVLIVFFILLSLLGSETTRTFVEIFTWGTVLIYHEISRMNSSYKHFAYDLLQTNSVKIIASTISICVLSITLILFSKPIVGSIFSWDKQIDFYRKHAVGYQLFEKVNNILPENSIIISQPFGFVWSKPEVAPADWMLFNYGGNQDPYKRFMLSKKPTHVILENLSNKNPYYSFLKSCLGSELAVIPVKIAARNPFNRDLKTYTNNKSLMLKKKKYSLFKLDDLTCFK